MPLPTTYQPFDYLVTQIQQDLNKAVDLCREIKRGRHVGKCHRQLDCLEEGLEEGPSFVRREYRRIDDLKGADPSDHGDDIVRVAFHEYVDEVECICAHLEAIAHPPTHHSNSCSPTRSYGSRSSSRHRSHSHHHREIHVLPMMLGLDIHHGTHDGHHKQLEDPHFHDMLLKWEAIRDGIVQCFAAFRDRLEREQGAKKKKKEDEDKYKKEKDEAKEKADKAMKEEKEKAAKDKKKLQDKLDAQAKADEEELDSKKEHERKRLKHEDAIQDQRDDDVEDLVKKQLKRDPIGDVERVADAMAHIERVLTPRSSRHSISHHDRGGVNLHVCSNSASSETRVGGGGGGAMQYLTPSNQLPIFISPPAVQQSQVTFSPAVLTATTTAPAVVTGPSICACTHRHSSHSHSSHHSRDMPEVIVNNVVENSPQAAESGETISLDGTDSSSSTDTTEPPHHRHNHLLKHNPEWHQHHEHHGGHLRVRHGGNGHAGRKEPKRIEVGGTPMSLGGRDGFWLSAGEARRFGIEGTNLNLNGRGGVWVLA